MRTFPLHPVLLVSLLALGACNGGEDFSDAIPGPVQEGNGSSFNAEDNCAARIVGALLDDGVVRNVRYECDGFHGATGLTGLESERNQNFFVCPRTAKSINFYIGGKTRQIPLGRARFRVAPEDKTTCTASKYVSSGPYFFSLADLFDAPARVDILAPDTEGELAARATARNITALLQALDVDDASHLVEISTFAHRVLFEGDLEDDEIPHLDGSFMEGLQPFLDGTVAFCESQSGTDCPEQIGVAPPADIAEADARLRRGAYASVAGVYSFEPGSDLIAALISIGLLGHDCEECFENNQLITGESLYHDIAQTVTGKGDPVLGQRLSDYIPIMTISRSGQLRFAGPFDLALLPGEAPTGTPDDFRNEFAYQCDVNGTGAGRFPVFLTSTATSALRGDLVLEQLRLEDASDAFNVVQMDGRIINGHFYNGIASTSGQPDYVTHYPGLPASAHAFDETVDSTRFRDSELCGVAVNRQPLLGFSRSAFVTPFLDDQIMETYFPSDFTLEFQRRQRESEHVCPGVDQENCFAEEARLVVTVHADGAITTVVEGAVHEVGMVTSIQGDADESAPGEHSFNVLVFLSGPASLAEDLPLFGSHFRARLTPRPLADAPGECADVLRDPLNPGLANFATWYDPHGVVTRYQQEMPGTLDDKYELLRHYGYGVVFGRHLDCTD